MRESQHAWKAHVLTLFVVAIFRYDVLLNSDGT
jgi:hypothetical protein